MQTQILNIVQVVLALLVIVVILIQVKGQGTGLFGAAESSFHTRRGLEKTLYQFTIFLVVVFVGASIVSAKLIRG